MKPCVQNVLTLGLVIIHYKIYFVFLIFVVYANPENVFTTKISRSAAQYIWTRIIKWESRSGVTGTVTTYQNIATFLTRCLLPHAGVGSSKKLARRHASENLLARMEEEGINTDPSLIKPKRKVCTCASVCLGHSLLILILSVFVFFSLEITVEF